MTSRGTPWKCPFVVLKLSPSGNEVELIAKLATSPPTMVGAMSTKASLGMMYVPFPYEMLAIGSLMVKSKLILLTPPSLETCSWKVCWVRLTVGVPHIVPLSSPSWSPDGSAGTNVQLMMLPLTSEGSIGVISVPRSRTKEVWL